MVQFVIKKISDRGTQHPVVARLAIQIKELIVFANLDKSIKDSVLKACLYTLQSRLGKCWDICQWLEDEQLRIWKEYKPTDERASQIPNISDLDRNVENFLYEAKNFLRDLLNDVIAKCFPEIDFLDAGSFFDPKDIGNGRFARWAEEKYGTDDGFTKMAQEDQRWIAELVRKRNAIEHPGGYSGELIIQNIEAIGDGKIIAPVWQRTGTEPSHISIEMREYCSNLLMFAEEVIIFGCIAKNCVSPLILFGEIDENDRNLECPTRFKAMLNKEIT